MPQANDGEEELGQSAPTGDSEVSPAAIQDNTDYKALYEQESQKAEQWKEAALISKRKLRQKAEPVSEEAPAVETEDERVTRLVSEVSTRVVATVTEDSLLKNKVSNPEERKLVKFYLENTLKRTGTSEEALEADIETALTLARGKKALLDNAEIKRAVANDSRVPANAGGNADRGVDRKPHEWTVEQEKALDIKAKALGVEPEKFKKAAWDNRAKTHIA